MSLLVVLLLALAALAHGVRVKRSLDLCGICSQVVGEAQTLAANGLSQAQVAAALDQDICPHFGAFQAECNGIVSEFLPAALAAGSASPSTVCRSVGLCVSPTTQLVVLAQPQKPQGLSGGFCPECEAIVAFVESYLTNNSTEKAIEKKLDGVCKLLGGLEAACTAFVNDELPAIIQHLEKKETPAEVCTKLNVCHNSTALVVLPKLAALKPSQAPAGGFCSTCEAAVSFAEGWIAQNASEAEIAAYLDDFCKLTPYASECVNLVNAYLPQVIHYIELKENATTVCHQIGACTTANEYAAILGARLAKIAADVQAEGYCGLCQDAVGFAESWLANNASIADVENFLDDVCNVVPPIYTAECKQYVQQYVPVLVAYIKQNEPPQTVCTDAGLCSSNQRPVLTALVPAVVEAPKAPEASGFCGICEAIVGFVESYVEQNKTVVEIEQNLDSLCKLTGPYEAECKALVAAYTPQFVHWVEQKETPANVCAQVGVCASNGLKLKLLELVAAPVKLAEAKKEDAAVVAVGGANPVVCDMCKMMVSYLYVYVQHNDTLTKIEKGLDKLCKFTGALEMECDALVAQFAPEMIKMVEARETPEKICEKVKACDATPAPTSAPAPPTAAPTAALAVAASAEGCSLCELVVSVGDHYAAANSTVALVESEVNKLCDAAPAEYRDMCHAAVAIYVPKLDGWAVDKTKGLCVEAGLCTKA